ncbi:mitochondrial fission ELM1 family protein [Lysobacter korlensis]|uniref:Mitochondrial fission ELM1 family protein n=1 Tax=Lysobacter korlensis TaxID=553636 RepID=A0ABV6RU42_9GAMM
MQRFADAPDCWTLTDGHAGNVRQAQALAAALDVQARDWTLQSRAPWRWLAPRMLPSSAAAFGAEFEAAFAQPPALAIGCGRQAALATRVLRGRGSFAVQILDPRISPMHWDIVVAPEHDGLAGGNVITLMGSLHPVDEAWLAQARARFDSLRYSHGPQLALLAGGTSAHARIDAATFEPIASALRHWAAERGGRILATASRRTPEDVRDRLHAWFGQAPHQVWTGEADGANPYAGLLGWADGIVCTADSVNMLSEACATTAPVFVAGADALQGRPRRFVDQLLQRGRVRRLEDGLEMFECAPLRETARVAAEVRQRLQARGR